MLVALAVAFQGASSQAVEGRVVGAATGQPIPGALVLLLDSGRVERARAASAVGGTFRLAASAPGEYRFVVLRIGFARWESPPLRLEAGRTLQYVVELPEEPLQLGGITVERESGCRVRPAAGETAGVLWEEARKALALAEVTKRERRYLFHMVKTERRLGVTLQPLEDARVTNFSVSSWSFVSAPADSLTRLGFVMPQADGGFTYYGPDVEVLFSEVFLELHCFRLHAGDDSTVIGLAFEPVRRRRVPDITGVLWLDRRSAALRRIEFSYTNLEAWIPRGPAGGSIDFDVLPTGAWVIRRWLLRAPVEQRIVSGADRRTTVGGWVEFTGEVGEVLGPDGRVVRSYRSEP